MPESQSSNYLWDQLRQGHKSALKEIYESESGYLFNYGRKIFQDTVIVEDAIQDLFIEIWQKHSSLGPTDSIRRYLAASLRRKIIAKLKKNSKTESVDSFDQLSFNPELAIESMIIAKEMSEEKAAKLKQAFEKLSDRQREILFLKFYQGLDYEQISEVLDIQYQSLRNMVSRGIKKLRAEMLIWILLMINNLN